MDRSRRISRESVYFCLILSAVLASIAFMALHVYAIEHYGGVSIADCPIWVRWFMCI